MQVLPSSANTYIFSTEHDGCIHTVSKTGHRKTVNDMGTTPSRRTTSIGTYHKFELRQDTYLNIQCIVEATLAGQKLYQKGGFTVERDFYLDAGEKYADRPKDHLLFMVRPRGVQTSTEEVTSCNVMI